MTQAIVPTGAWSDFCEALDFGALVPDALAEYRPAVVDGLMFFLENLGEERADEILGEQLMLPAEAGVAERLVAIARHCPALHKLGQVLARDRRLPLQFRLLLQHLESMPSSLDAAQAQALVEAELGPISAFGGSIDGPPLAEASVAVVVPFTAPREGGGEVVRGVFKLLKPGVEAKLEEELGILQRIGALLDERCEAYRLPPIAYEETFLQVRDLLAREVQLDHEQAHMTAARDDYAGLASVVVPEVYPWSTPRVTAMQRIDGVKVTEAPALSPGGRKRLAKRIVLTLVARPIWSRGASSLFHADPHAGNLFATTDDKLGILDWSLVGRLSKSDRVCLTQVLLGAFTVDGERIRHAIDEMAQGRGDAAALAALIEARVARLTEGAWPGMSWVMQLLDEAATRARCRFAADLVMFRKALQTLEGVVADVSPDCRPDHVLTVALLRELAAEWGRRSWALPFSRDFATHVSNLDLTQLWASSPLIGSRQLLGLRSHLREMRSSAR